MSYCFEMISSSYNKCDWVSCDEQITEKCLSSIFKLQHLEDLVLEGCFGVGDDSLSNEVFKQGCKTLKVYMLKEV